MGSLRTVATRADPREVKLTERIVVIEEEAIPGIADLVEGRPGDDPREIASVLLQRANEVDIGSPISRGPERYLSIVERIRRRKLVKDLGSRQFSLDWLSFHVPAGASGRLKVKHIRKETFGATLKVLGFGFGAGRSLSLAVEDDFGERGECMRMQRTFEGHFRAFEDRAGKPYIQVDVVKVLSDDQNSSAKCDHCGIGVLPQTSFPPVAESAIDVRKDPHGRAISQVTSLDENKEFEISLPISFPGFKVTPAIVFKRIVQLECTYSYTLPGGYCYTPYRNGDGWKDLPFWLRT